jgi:hypothetical protein
MARYFYFLSIKSNYSKNSVIKNKNILQNVGGKQIGVTILHALSHTLRYVGKVVDCGSVNHTWLLRSPQTVAASFMGTVISRSGPLCTTLLFQKVSHVQFRFGTRSSEDTEI